MRILVTNDDGINAPGLEVAISIARGIGDEVWIVAPETEQSGVSHCISYTSPMMLQQISERNFSVSGTPADCVIMALNYIMKDTPPDLILSGVNRGHNFAQDTLYSGTVGAAIEADFQGVKAIALSQAYGNSPNSPDDIFTISKAMGAKTVRKILALPWHDNTFYNINFPHCPLDALNGVKLAPQGRRSPGAFIIEERKAPSGKPYYWNVHTVDNQSASPDSDCVIATNGWISVTPMKTDLTNYNTLAELEKIF